MSAAKPQQFWAISNINQLSPKLIELLEHPEGETRKSCALSLMKIGDRTVIEPLQTALVKESDEGVKKAIALAISLLERQSEEDKDWD